MADLNAAETLALARLLPKKITDAARAAIDTEGESFDLDFTVRITGKLAIDEVQYGIPQINKLSPWQLLKFAMDKMNDATLQKFIKDALAEPAFDDKTNADDKKFKDRTAKAWKKMADSSLIDRNGKITATGLELTKI